MIKVRNMLVNALPGVTVYDSFVPETETNPAVALTNVSLDNFTRVLEGEKTGKWQVWRVQVVAARTSDVESILRTLDTLDNTRNDDFQRVRVELVNLESRQPNQPYRRAFVDVIVYY